MIDNLTCTICGSPNHYGIYQCPVAKERLQVKLPWISPVDDPWKEIILKHAESSKETSNEG